MTDNRHAEPATHTAPPDHPGPAAPSGDPARSPEATAWLRTVCEILGIDEKTERATLDDILRLTSAVAHNRPRPTAPVTAFLLGLSFAEGATRPGTPTPEEVSARARAIIRAIDETDPTNS